MGIEEVIAKIEAMKKPNGNSYHCSSCSCPQCRYATEDCVCAFNQAVEEIVDNLRLEERIGCLK